MPQYKFKKLLQLLLWPGYRYDKRRGVFNEQGEDKQGERIIIKKNGMT